MLNGLDLKALNQKSNILCFREVIFKSAESKLEQQEPHGMLENKEGQNKPVQSFSTQWRT